MVTRVNLSSQFCFVANLVSFLHYQVTMIEVRVFLYLAAGDLSEAVDQGSSEFPIVPRVNDYITHASTGGDIYKVIRVVLLDGGRNPIVFCIGDSIDIPNVDELE